MQELNKGDISEALGEKALTTIGMPELESIDWGVLDYLGWVHPAGHLGYVVFPLNDQLFGLTMRRMINHGQKPRTHMCSWCHHVYRSRGTAMFSTAVHGSDGRRLKLDHTGYGR